MSDDVKSDVIGRLFGQNEPSTVEHFIIIDLDEILRPAIFVGELGERGIVANEHDESL